MMSVLLGRPLVLHEQNSIAGLANKVLAKLADKNLCAFPNSLPNATWVGNPLRAEMSLVNSPAERYQSRSGVLNILVVGGSLGAAVLNSTIPEAISLMPKENRPQITHQSGEKHLEALNKTYAGLGVTANVLPFIEDMKNAYVEADLVICRAGAMTVAELAAVGVASYLVPFPHAVDDHQTSNAKFLADVGAAVLVPQQSFNPEKLANYLSQINREELQKMAEQALTLAKPMATKDVAQICKQFCKDGAQV